MYKNLCSFIVTALAHPGGVWNYKASRLPPAPGACLAVKGLTNIHKGVGALFNSNSWEVADYRSSPLTLPPPLPPPRLLARSPRINVARRMCPEVIRSTCSRHVIVNPLIRHAELSLLPLDRLLVSNLEYWSGDSRSSHILFGQTAIGDTLRIRQ